MKNLSKDKYGFIIYDTTREKHAMRHLAYIMQMKIQKKMLSLHMSLQVKDYLKL